MPAPQPHLLPSAPATPQVVSGVPMTEQTQRTESNVVPDGVEGVDGGAARGPSVRRRLLEYLVIAVLAYVPMLANGDADLHAVLQLPGAVPVGACAR